MTDLFSKFDALIGEREALLSTGVRDPFAIVMDEVKSPTQAVIKGKDTILRCAVTIDLPPDQAAAKVKELEAKRKADAKAAAAPEASA